MNKNQVRQFLLDHPGYLNKTNVKRLAYRCSCSVSLVKEVLAEIRNSQNYAKAVATPKTENKELLEYLRLREAGIEIIRTKLPSGPSNVLVVGDLHCPFDLDGYLDFCKEQYKKYNCSEVVFIGDLIDNHAISYHEHDPDGRSANDEFNLALTRLRKWYKAFPVAKVCIGNHDSLPFRKAFTAGLPKSWLKSYEELLECPRTWNFQLSHTIDDVIYTHGTGMSGEMAAVNAARENRQSTVIGHLHTISNIKYMASYKDLIFGMTVGCGIDHEAYSFAYAKLQARKPVISCGIVEKGRIPHIIPMILK